MKRKTLFVLAFLLAAILMAFIGINASVRAKEGQPRVPTDDEVNAIAKKLYCPVCPNTPLDVCETQACKDWRAQIRDQLASGWNEQQIMNYFVEQYGERVLGEPQRSGFSSMVWVLPLIAVLMGLVIVWQVLCSWRSKQGWQETLAVSTANGSNQISPELWALVEKELKEFD
jgi:cytochrome c-type biogenesis protein CcmH